jgi:hypothetical protein
MDFLHFHYLRAWITKMKNQKTCLFSMTCGYRYYLLLDKQPVFHGRCRREVETAPEGAVCFKD